MHILSLIFTLINVLLLIAIIALIILAICALAKYLSTKKDRKTVQEHPGETSSQKRPLGEILKDLRVKNNMTQEYVAEKLNITRQAVSKWEAGQSSPSMANLISLAKLYDISVEELLKDMQY